MERISYAVLKYYNSIISEECLCVGIAFQNLSTGERYFNYIKNYQRLQIFDDEIDTNFVKLYLGSIQEEIEPNIFNFNTPFDLNLYVKNYVNEFKFSKVFTTDTDDPLFVQNITKLYLKYDYDRKERLSKNTEQKYIRQIIRSSNKNFTSRPVIGKKREPINYDYQNDEYAIKLFSFKDKTLSRLMSSAKTWAYNAQEMSDTKKTIFLYDIDITESKDFSIIFDILAEHAYKIMPFEDGIEFITSFL